MSPAAGQLLGAAAFLAAPFAIGAIARAAGSVANGRRRRRRLAALAAHGVTMPAPDDGCRRCGYDVRPIAGPQCPRCGGPA